MSKIFFSEVRAERFAETLREQGYTAQVWMDRDGFKQTIYIVKW